jgi:hypothetical protein
MSKNETKISLDCPFKNFLYYYLARFSSVRAWIRIRIRIRIRIEFFSWIRILIFSMRNHNTACTCPCTCTCLGANCLICISPVSVPESNSTYRTCLYLLRWRYTNALVLALPLSPYLYPSLRLSICCYYFCTCPCPFIFTFCCASFSTCTYACLSTRLRTYTCPYTDIPVVAPYLYLFLSRHVCLMFQCTSTNSYLCICTSCCA